MSEIFSIYYDVKFTTKEALEKEQYACPVCGISNSLSVTDSLFKDSSKYHGVKYECSYCYDAFAVIDSSCLPKQVSDEIGELLTVSAEFHDDEFASAFCSE